MSNTTSKASPAFAGSRMASYLTKQIEAVSGRKSQREIANEIGYTKPNIISNFKRGDIRIPMDKVVPLARALGVDPAFMFRIWLEDVVPNGTKDVMEIFGDIATKTERDYLAVMREVHEDGLPPLNEERRARLKEAIV